VIWGRSLAAYGIDPTQAVVAPIDNPEDGGVEEEDKEDGEEEDDDDEDDSEDDEDDVKIDFTGGARVLDLR
jgi:pre-mRNA 3'-end-processing factor FIP1